MDQSGSLDNADGDGLVVTDCDDEGAGLGLGL